MGFAGATTLTTNPTLATSPIVQVENQLMTLSVASIDKMGEKSLQKSMFRKESI